MSKRTRRPNEAVAAQRAFMAGDGREADARGVPFKPRPGHYRAGYSLNHQWI